MKKESKILAVFFDLGETLARLVPEKEAIFQKAAKRIGIRLPLAGIRKAYFKAQQRHPYSSIKIRSQKDRELFYARFHRAICRELGIEKKISTLNPVLRKEFELKKQWKLYADVRRTLDTLRRRRIPLGLIANWDKDLEKHLGELKIKSYFKVIVGSQEAGVEKPSARIFKLALRRMGVSPRQGMIIYVGNDYELDVVGARNAAMAPVLIDRVGRYARPDCAVFSSLKSWVSGPKATKI